MNKKRAKKAAASANELPLFHVLTAAQREAELKVLVGALAQSNHSRSFCQLVIGILHHLELFAASLAATDRLHLVLVCRRHHFIVSLLRGFIEISFFFATLSF